MGERRGVRPPWRSPSTVIGLVRFKEQTTVRIVYHLIPRTTWEQAPPGPYHAASLASEGFIHLSNATQVAASGQSLLRSDARTCLPAAPWMRRSREIQPVAR